VSAPYADSWAELIADCTAIPANLRTTHADLPIPRLAATWSVPDECVAQADELDEFV